MLEYSELTKKVNKLITIDSNDQIHQLIKSIGIIPKQDKDLSANIKFLLKKTENEIFTIKITENYNISIEDFKIVLKNLRDQRNYIAHPTPERLNDNNELLPQYYIKALIDGLLPFYKMCSIETSVIYDYYAQLNYYNNHHCKMYSKGIIKKIIPIVAVGFGCYIFGSNKEKRKNIIDKEK